MYNGITSKGSQYLAKCQAEGLPIKLSKVKIGNGTIQDLENPYNFTDVKSIKQEFEISEKSQVEEQLKIKVQIDNTSLEEGYFTKEIGIYADDNGQEILYWYINDGDQASWLPPASVSPVKFKYTFNIQVTTTETVIVNFTGKELWVDREFLNTELVKKLDKGTVPNSLNTAEKIVAALQGNGGLKFDENLLYLNDKGTKKKGGYYLDRLAEGIFECLEQTEETVNNSAKFKNISNKENSDRLDNLGNPLPKFYKFTLTKEPLYIGKGLFLVYRFHNGFYVQSKLYLMSISNFTGDVDKFVQPISLDSLTQNNAYSLEYNPKTAQVKISSLAKDNRADYIFMKLI